MTPRYAELTFVVEPDGAPLPPPVPRFVCEFCRSGARHNLILRLSFCPIHGFAGSLVEVHPTGYARAHGGSG
ncbi:MAG: hypothetical protein WAK40_00765 [Thermoplasmata archaeon]